MRWFWIDRFTEFVVGERGVAVKACAFGQPPMDDNPYSLGALPGPLIVEGIAQTSGLVLSALSQFRERVVLAKITRAAFHEFAWPGDLLTYRIEVIDVQDEGAIVKGTSHAGDKLQAEIELMLAFMGSRLEQPLFEPAQFCRWLRTLGVFDCARFPDGSPLQVPEHFLAAELAEAGMSAVQEPGA